MIAAISPCRTAVRWDQGAAAAELAGLMVLHMDKDFEVIAEISGQPIERLNM
jgi:hypothetical protein